MGGEEFDVIYKKEKAIPSIAFSCVLFFRFINVTYGT